MRISGGKISEWLRQTYEKLLLVAALVLLLVSSLYLLLRVRVETESLRSGSWEEQRTPEHPVKPLDAAAFEEGLAVLRNPYQASRAEAVGLMASEVRVSCIQCLKPIPFEAMVCPYCRTAQPDITTRDKMDSDGDGLPDQWEIDHGLDPHNPRDAHLDLDGDGFTNLEEFLHGTDPRDPDSFPPPWIKLRVAATRAVPFPLVFESVATLPGGDVSFGLNNRRQGSTSFVRLGERVMGYTVESFDPDAPRGPTLVLRRTDREQRLVRHQVLGESDWIALVVSLLDGAQFRVQPDDEIVVRDSAYKVVDIKRDGVILHAAGSEEPLAVPMVSDQERNLLRQRGDPRRMGAPEGMPPPPPADGAFGVPGPPPGPPPDGGFPPVGVGLPPPDVDYSDTTNLP